MDEFSESTDGTGISGSLTRRDGAVDVAVEQRYTASVDRLWSALTRSRSWPNGSRRCRVNSLKAADIIFISTRTTLTNRSTGAWITASRTSGWC